jgi:hypothetical protein
VIWVDLPFQVNKNGQGDSLRDSSASPTNKVFFSKQKGKIMKGLSILSLMASLTILGIGALTKPESVAMANQHLVDDTVPANSQTASGRSQTIAQQSKSQLITWRQFVEQGGGRYIQVDYDLPNEFRNGYVYFNQGASVITAYLLKQGLSSYPPLKETGLGEIDVIQGDRYVKSGQAILFFWNLGNSGLQYANDTQVRFTQKGTGCFRTNCLTAPFMTNEQISRILRSKRRIEQKK